MKIIRTLRKIVTSINPVLSDKIMFKKQMKYNLNLKNPTTFNEKINYLKLYVYPNDDLIIKCADKYEVRNYLKTKNLEKYLVELIGCWDNVEDINWKELPNKFVLKCNHGCAYNIICNDKNNLDINEVKSKLNKWMKEDFGKVSAERHYSKIPKKIICEKFLEDEIKDYKFFCFNGKPEFFYISKNIDGDFHNMVADFFYLDGKKAEFGRKDHAHFNEDIKLPDNLNEMIEVAKKLSENFDFVRVDLFNVNSKIYFSELTFSPCAGFMPIYPDEYDEKLGNLLVINKNGDENE